MRTLIALALAGCSGGDASTTAHSTSAAPTWDTYFCFAAGTPIATPSGDRRIETLEPGELVLSWDTEADSLVERRVLAHHRREAPGALTLEVDGGAELTVTAEHPFWDPLGRAWVEAGALGTGSLVAELVEGDLLPVQVASIEQVPGALRVHNLTVAGPEHNYFAGGVLVHNKMIGPTILDYVEVACPTPDRLTANADTVGWTSESFVHFIATASAPSPAEAHSEEHEMQSVDFGNNGFWDYIEVLLDTEAGDSWVPNTSTRLSCSGLQTDNTFAMRVYDEDGSFTDCAIWGHDAAGLLRGDYGVPGTMLASELGSCLDWTR